MQGRLLVFLGAASFGALSTIVKLAYAQGFSVAQVVTSQLWFGAAICLLIAGAYAVFQSLHFPSFQQSLQLLASGFPLGLTSFAYYECVERVPASIAILLLFQFVWIGLILDLLFKKQRPSNIQIMAVAILLLGTALAANVLQDGLLQLNPVGVAYGLLGALGYAIFIFMSGQSPHTHFSISAFLRAFGGALFSLLFYSPFTGLQHIFTNQLYIYGIPLAIFGMVIPPLFFAKGIPQIGATESSIISAVELPVVILCARFILAENVSITQWTGVILICIGVILPQIITKKTVIS